MVFNFLFSLLTILIPLSYRKTRTYLKVGYVINIIQFSYFIMVWYIAYCIEKDQHRIIRLTNENYRLEGIIHNLNRNEEIIPINNWSDIKMDSKCSLDIKNWYKTNNTCFVCQNEYDTLPIFKCSRCKNVICLLCAREWTKTRGQIKKCLGCQNIIRREDLKFYTLSNASIKTMLRENRIFDILNNDESDLTIDEMYQLKKNILIGLFPNILQQITEKKLDKNEEKDFINMTIERLTSVLLSKKKN